MPLSQYALIMLHQPGAPTQLGGCKAKGTQGQPSGALLCIEMATMLAYEVCCVNRVWNDDCASTSRLCMLSAKDVGVWRKGTYRLILYPSFAKNVLCNYAICTQSTRDDLLRYVYSTCTALLSMFIVCLFRHYTRNSFQDLYCAQHVAIPQLDQPSAVEATPRDIGGARSQPRTPHVNQICDSKNNSKIQTQHS